jgi:UDPglucose 6-dehydrogenase
LISSQVPVGFTRALEKDWSGRNLTFAYSPENLRLGKAIDAFRKPERVIIGSRIAADKSKLATLFGPFCQRLEWMSVESAEMTKHALNAFLATSVAFINEIARLCEVLGADAREVERGLKSEGRIGTRAYLGPGNAFAGGTLARDLRYLVEFGKTNQVGTPLFGGVLQSNELHTNWMHDKIHQLLVKPSQSVVAIFGLTYTPGTSTLRRSAAVELAVWLHQQGIRVRAHDPGVQILPEELKSVMELCSNPQEAMTGADAVVIATEWPDYLTLQANDFIQCMRQPQVIDQNWFLAKLLSGDSGISYFATGKHTTR